MSSLSMEDLILDLLVALFFFALFVVGIIKIQKIRKKNYFSKTYYLFVGSFCGWTFGKAIITAVLMAVPSLNDCEAATIFAGVNASAVMEMCKYGSYMGLILIWGDLFLLSFEQTPQQKRETPKPITNLLIIFVALMVFLFLILFGTNLAYYFAFDNYCDSHHAQSTLHILFASSYCFVYLSTVVITVGFWKYLYSLFLDLLAERQTLKQNSAFNKTLLTLAGISLFCLVSFVLKSFFILGSLFLEDTYYIAVVLFSILECSCGALLLYGATLDVPMQDNDPHQPLLPSSA